MPHKKGEWYMENILDLLYEYSKRGKNIDKEFMDKVIKIMTTEKGLRNFIKRVRFEDLSSYRINHDEANTPMAYDPYAKKILLDSHNIEIFRDEIKKLTLNSNFSDFEQALSSNSILTQALLHEIEHANQYRKSMIRDENFENLLLGVCCHIDNDFFKESKFSQFLMLKRGIYLNPQLYYNLALQQQLNVKFKASNPIERMANIHSTQEINGMLVQINKNDCIENVISLFDSLLAGFQLNGYNSNNGIKFSDRNIFRRSKKTKYHWNRCTFY